MNMKQLSAVGAAAILAFPLQAQEFGPGQVEIGAYGTYTKFDNTGTTLASQVGAGGSFGLFMTSLLSIEASGGFTTTEVAGTVNDVEASRIGGTLLANMAHGAGSLFLGLGYERIFYRAALSGDENGFHLVLGNRFNLGGRITFRVQANAALFPSSTLIPGEDKAFNLGLSAGFSVISFGGTPRDTDGDLVLDRNDDCPDTPMGATVDVVGCPSDSDEDGILDGLDQCAATPRGAIRDANGCPSDPDNDGVFVGLDACPDTPAGAVVDPNGCPVDSDSDGVFDGLDACPNTAPNSPVNETGCPTDEDGDGVFDGLDQCVGTPVGVTVDATGCPADSDGDGVLDDADACPATSPGVPVSANGCEIISDSDNDGVGDNEDRCPNTQPGRNVDSIGCPVLFEVTQGQAAQPLILQGVNFRSGSSQLIQSSFAVLDQVAASLLANPIVRIQVVGHTDGTGGRTGNLRISLLRANSVRDYLISRGVATDRLESLGMGPDEPVATNATAEGRAQNRRVELRLLQN